MQLYYFNVIHTGSYWNVGMLEYYVKAQLWINYTPSEHLKLTTFSHSDLPFFHYSAITIIREFIEKTPNPTYQKIDFYFSTNYFVHKYTKTFVINKNS